MNLTSLLVLAQAAPAPEGAAPSSGIFLIGQLVFLGVIFYFLLIRPQQKRAKEHTKLIASIRSGDKVILNSGLHGIVANVKDKTVLIKVADNVKLEYDRGAVVTIDRSDEAELEVVKA